VLQTRTPSLADQTPARFKPRIVLEPDRPLLAVFT
jgi:hypothetical protein